MNWVRRVARRFPRIGPAERVSLGLASLIVSSVLVLDFAFGIFPDRIDTLRKERALVSEQFAVQSVAALHSGGENLLIATMQNWMERDAQIRSMAVRAEDGSILAGAGDHASEWREPEGSGVSSLQHVRVPLMQSGRQWGHFEISYAPRPDLAGWRYWIKQPVVLILVFVGGGGVLMFTIYLRRVFEYLDPQSVIPDRVRTAFDAFSEGVMVVDPAGRIVLANSVVRQWLGREGQNIIGRPVRRVPSLNAALPQRTEDHPWMQAMERGESVRGGYLELERPDGELVKTTVNCSPVQDIDGKTRGCIVTFDDVSEIERVNRRLVETLNELKASRAEVEARNVELQRLAMIDPLTGCLNRRSFFESFAILFAESRKAGEPVACMMIDVDFFKSFNDRFGHSTGDQVLKAVAQILAGGARSQDLLCRYGGEEFSIVMPGTTASEAEHVAQRLRRDIESRTAKAIRGLGEINVTASFGIAELDQDATPESLISSADRALYVAKESGRNRVVVAGEQKLAESLPA